MIPKHGDITSKFNSGEFADVFKRMDEDESLMLLDEYEMKDWAQNPVDGIFNVTSNLPATFNAHVKTSLMQAEQQVRVEGEQMGEDQQTEIEEFLVMALGDANRLLRARGEPTLRSSTADQVNLRGRAANRTTSRIVAGRLIPGILPLDSRQLVWERSAEAFRWTAYRTWRSAADINDEYPGAGVKGSGDTEVIDIWDETQNMVLVNGKEARAPYTHRYAGNPTGVEIVQLGSTLKTQKSRPAYGESIYFLMRKMPEQLNLILSVMQTVNVTAVKGGKTYHTKEGGRAKIPADIDMMGAWTALEIDGTVQLVPTGDIKDASRLMHSTIMRFMQIGGMSLTDFGNLTFPLSAVALVELGEQGGAIFLPRLGTQGLLYEKTCEAIIKQTVDSGANAVMLGPPGRERVFQVKDLRGSYGITFEYFIKDPATDVARIQVGEAAKAIGVDEDTIRRDILKLPNPDEVKRRKLIERASEISPAIEKFDIASALLREGQRTQDTALLVKARIMAEDMGTTIEELLGGEVADPQVSVEPARNQGNLMPLVDEGTRAASNTRATQLQGQVAEGAGG